MKNHIIFYIYLILFSFYVYFPAKASILLLLITFLNFIISISSSKNDTIVLLSSTIMGSEFFSIINIVLYIIAKLWQKKNINKINMFNNSSIIPIFIIFASSLISSLISGTTINFLFYLIYLVILFISYQFIGIDIQKEEFISLIKKFIILEFIASLVIIFRVKSFLPGDLNGGTLLNAHFFANWLFLSLFSLIFIKQNTKKNCLLYVVLVLIMIYLASAVAVLFSAIISVILYFIINKNSTKEKNDLFWMMILSYFTFFIILNLLYCTPIMQYLQNKNTFIKLYIYTPGYNYKLQYFYGTFNDSLKGFRSIFGFGLGQYGSRVANAFAYNSMWRANNFVNNFISNFFQPRVVPQYERYISFYTQNFVDGIKWRSAVMSYPFSSFISLIGETGILGVVLVANWINKTFKNHSCKILIYYFIIACVFDLFFDNYQCILILMIYVKNFNNNIIDIKNEIQRN